MAKIYLKRVKFICSRLLDNCGRCYFNKIDENGSHCKNGLEDCNLKQYYIQVKDET